MFRPPSSTVTLLDRPWAPRERTTPPVSIPRQPGTPRAPSSGTLPPSGPIRQITLRHMRHGYDYANDDLLDPSVTWRYLIRTDGTIDAARLRMELERHSDFPVPGRAVSLGTGTALAYVKSLSIEPIDNEHFQVEAQSQPVTGDARNLNQDQNQTDNSNNNNRPPTGGREVEVTFQPISIPMEVAKFYGFQEDGLDWGDMWARHPDQMPLKQWLPVTNSALAPYDPPAEIEVQITIVRLTFPSRALQLGTAWDGLTNAVNSSPFAISWPDVNFSIAAHSRWQALLKHVGGRFVRSDAGAYWQLSAEIHFNPLTWAIRLLDQGHEMIDSEKLNKISANPLKTPFVPRTRIRSRDGSASATPILLDGTGKPADITRMGRLVPWAGIWMPYNELDFNRLF